VPAWHRYHDYNLLSYYDFDHISFDFYYIHVSFDFHFIQPFQHVHQFYAHHYYVDVNVFVSIRLLHRNRHRFGRIRTDYLWIGFLYLLLWVPATSLRYHSKWLYRRY